MLMILNRSMKGWLTVETLKNIQTFHFGLSIGVSKIKEEDYSVDVVIKRADKTP